MTAYIIRHQDHDSRPFPTMTEAEIAALRAMLEDYDVVPVEAPELLAKIDRRGEPND